MNLRIFIIAAVASLALAGNSFAKTAGCPCSPCKCAPCTCGGGGSKSGGGGKHHDKEHGHAHDHGSSAGVGGTIDLSRVGHRNAEPDPFAAGGGDKPVAHTEEKHPAKHKDHEPNTATFDDIELTGVEGKGDMPPQDTFNVDNRTGGQGNQAAGGPKGAPKGKGNAAAAVCSDCASPILTVTYDSQTSEVKTGPYGDTKMGKPPYDLTVEGGCITCGKDNICCCAITKIGVVLHFQINVNTDKIDKGVWMNTADDPKKLGKTKPTAPKDGDKDKDEWKKVDKDSVVKHEKTHCDDVRKAIEDNLKEGLKGNAFTPSPCSDKDCKKDNDACKKVLNDAKATIDTRMNANIDVVMKQLAGLEKEDYPGGPMEQNARKAQAKDLNERNK